MKKFLVLGALSLFGLSGDVSAMDAGQPVDPSEELIKKQQQADFVGFRLTLIKKIKSGQYVKFFTNSRDLAPIAQRACKLIENTMTMDEQTGDQVYEYLQFLFKYGVSMHLERILKDTYNKEDLACLFLMYLANREGIHCGNTYLSTLVDFSKTHPGIIENLKGTGVSVNFQNYRPFTPEELEFLDKISDQIVSIKIEKPWMNGNEYKEVITEPVVDIIEKAIKSGSLNCVKLRLDWCADDRAKEKLLELFHQVRDLGFIKVGNKNDELDAALYEHGAYPRTDHHQQVALALGSRKIQIGYIDSRDLRKASHGAPYSRGAIFDISDERVKDISLTWTRFPVIP